MYWKASDSHAERNAQNTTSRALLDAFITAGAPASIICDQNQSMFTSNCNTLGLPVAVDKQEGPTTCLSFIGIEVDTVMLELRLPHHKLLCLKTLLQCWAHLKCCRKKDLQSLVDQLHDASIIVCPGCTFIHRLIDLFKSAYHRPSNCFLRMNFEAHSDILCWTCFIEPGMACPWCIAHTAATQLLHLYLMLPGHEAAEHTVFLLGSCISGPLSSGTSIWQSKNTFQLYM